MRRFISILAYTGRPAFVAASGLLVAIPLPFMYRTAPSAGAGQTAAVAAGRGTAPVRTGASLYETRCAKCHDANGTGAGARDTMPEIPDFTSARWHKGRSAAQLRVAILEGKGKRMPAFAGRISAEEAGALVDYLRAFAPAQTTGTVEPADDFQERFRELHEEFERLRKQFHELHSGK
jgi:mono/diheme cytochrome c family protein